MSLTIELLNVKKVLDHLTDIERVAEYRALNKLSTQALSEAANVIRSDFPVKKSDVTKAVKKLNAHKFDPSVAWHIKGGRLNLSSPTQLKAGGISFTGEGRRRQKLTEQIRGGSKPFVITGRNSGKKLGVYRAPGYKRKVTTLKGASVPFMFKVKQIDNSFLSKYISRHFPAMFSEQLKRAKYGGRG